jgi:hypothetical protein
MRNGITGLRAYQQGGPILDKLRSLWEGIRGRADDPSLGYIGASMMPGIGEATDLVEIGAGLQDRSLGRVGLGLAGLMLPFVGAPALRKLLKGRRKSPMDEARRLKREALEREAFKAEFDMDVYKGTTVPLKPGEKEWIHFKPGEEGLFGPGSYGGDPNIANTYTFPSEIPSPDTIFPREGARIYPYKVRGKKLLYYGSPEYERILRDVDPTGSGISRGGGTWPREPGHPGKGRGTAIIDAAKKLGYEGIADEVGPDLIVNIFDPKNQRSPWAAFDPKKRHVADLLAGIGGLAGARYMSNALREDDEY